MTSCICWQAPADPDDDKSVAYAVHYPNDRGGQQEEGINIKQHYDPSLVVVEPIADAPVCMLFFSAFSFFWRFGALRAPQCVRARCGKCRSRVRPACEILPPSRFRAWNAHAQNQGLEIFDRRTETWLQVEAACEPGREMIVFGGQALERATRGAVKASLHRVSASNR